MLKSFARLALFSILPVVAQTSPRSIALTKKSNVPAKELQEALHKECANVSITDDATKSDYTLDALKQTNSKGVQAEGVNFILFDHDGKTLFKTSSILLDNAVKNLCHAINTTAKKK